MSPCAKWNPGLPLILAAVYKDVFYALNNIKRIGKAPSQPLFQNQFQVLPKNLNNLGYSCKMKLFLVTTSLVLTLFLVSFVHARPPPDSANKPDDKHGNKPNPAGHHPGKKPSPGAKKSNPSPLLARGPTPLDKPNHADKPRLGKKPSPDAGKHQTGGKDVLPAAKPLQPDNKSPPVVAPVPETPIPNSTPDTNSTSDITDGKQNN